MFLDTRSKKRDHSLNAILTCTKRIKICKWSLLSVDVETHDVIEKQNTTLNDDNKLKGKKKIAKLTVGLGIQRRGGGGMGSGAARYGGGEYLPEGKQPGAVIGAPWSLKPAAAREKTIAPTPTAAHQLSSKDSLHL
ncbi:hypothetical protein HZH68_000858 [Vespula germanica]|uniref:Uncharacterized protein n=1 Tax=Vespula germanica TaxID=30212 RepID=A0A834NUJ5_VESGE|nr:hypothetical protein HZH68_000858 [Vespula germanica]